MVDLKEEFFKRFHGDPEKIFFSPGRVNLIGEHIDYNGGKVMPCAISLGTFLAVSRNTDKVFRFQCLDFPETAEMHVQDAYSRNGKGWYNYPLGVIDYFARQGYELSGLNMLFSGNLPIGAGLSSSASIEVLTAYALSVLFEVNIDKLNIALLSKDVENNFIGLNCGIMDQFAVTFGEKDKAILLDCDTLDYDLLPFDTADYLLVIINTNKQRKLADSKYNERFAQCGEALKALRKEKDVKNLCDVDMNFFQSHLHLINDPVLEKRALHVISENKRVHDAAKVLKEGKLDEFGRLMYESHDSLKNLYEVSGVELDTIVEFCKTFQGCIGARMTGAGFGGCAIALIKKEKLNNFSNQLIAFYKSRIGYEPGIFGSAIGNGVRELV
jgi:galactokinase